MKKQTTEEKKRKMIQKAKRIRSIVMMALLSLMLLSAATYAWFTLGNQARVSNLTMTVSEVTGLSIALPESNGSAPSDESKWSGKIEFEDSEFKGKLLPATTSDGKKFSKPVYNEEGKVSGIEDTESADKLDKSNSDDNKEGYYYETKFYMRSRGKEGKIKLVKGENLTNKDTRKGTYTVVDTRDSKSGNVNGAAAIRISLTAGDKTAVYEPCANVSDTGVSAELEGYTPNVVASTAKQNSDGNFTTSDKNSEVLFTLKKDEATEVTLRIWVEGNADQCVNEMQLQKLVAQLQFIAESDN